MTFNSTQFAAIVETAKAKAASCPRWIRAIDRAAAALMSGELCVSLLAEGALVTSPRGSYRVTNHCECKASSNNHAECYHRAAARLTEMMESAPAPVPVRALDATAMAVCDAHYYTGARVDCLDCQAETREYYGAPRIERSIEQDRSGQRYTVVRCDGWAI